jgi:hypothetical protein
MFLHPLTLRTEGFSLTGLGNDSYSLRLSGDLLSRRELHRLCTLHFVPRRVHCNLPGLRKSTVPLTLHTMIAFINVYKQSYS